MNLWYSHRLAILTSAILVLLADFRIGPYITFPIIFILPLSAMAWWHSRRSAITLAVAMITIQIIYTTIWQPAIHHLLLYVLVNDIIRLAVFVLLIYLISQVAEQQRLLKHEVKILEGLLPICAHCKQIRTDKGEWQPIELYITQQSEATFTHSICPSCRQDHFGAESMARLRSESASKLIQFQEDLVH